jgi:uridine kinase
LNREELIAALAMQIAVVRRAHPIRVAIDGVDASGKTTLANELLQQLREYLERPRRGRSKPRKTSRT